MPVDNQNNGLQSDSYQEMSKLLAQDTEVMSQNSKQQVIDKIITILSKAIQSPQTSNNDTKKRFNFYLLKKAECFVKKDYSGIMGSIQKVVDLFINLWKLGKFTTTEKYILDLQNKLNIKEIDKQSIQDICKNPGKNFFSDEKEFENKVFPLNFDISLAANNLDPQENFLKGLLEPKQNLLPRSDSIELENSIKNLNTEIKIEYKR